MKIRIDSRLHCMSPGLLAIVALLFLVGGLQFAAAQQSRQPDKNPKNSNKADLIARGKYLVEGVAACGDCHTPRDENGDLISSRWLEGAPVFLKPAIPQPGWAIVAPRLAGLPPGSDAEIITLLTTGLWRGKPLRPPMPHFRMTRADAEAIIAYLKSLSSTH